MTPIQVIRMQHWRLSKGEGLTQLSKSLGEQESKADLTLLCLETSSEDIDFRAASEFFSSVSCQLTSRRRKSLGLLVNHGGRDVPTYGGHEP